MFHQSPYHACWIKLKYHAIRFSFVSIQLYLPLNAWYYELSGWSFSRNVTRLYTQTIRASCSVTYIDLLGDLISKGSHTWQVIKVKWYNKIKPSTLLGGLVYTAYFVSRPSGISTPILYTNIYLMFDIYNTETCICVSLCQLRKCSRK
jgi:hypothetical protein